MMVAMLSLLRAALVILLCLAAVSCGGGSKKTLGERIQGSDSYQKRRTDEAKKYSKMIERAAKTSEGVCGDEDPPYRFPGGAMPWPEPGVFRVHGVECRTARRWLDRYFLTNKAPRGYTCRGLILCWRGASASNAKHAPHWFSVSAK
jgi:hypothetical protein